MLLSECKFVLNIADINILVKFQIFAVFQAEYADFHKDVRTKSDLILNCLGLVMYQVLNVIIHTITSPEFREGKI